MQQRHTNISQITIKPCAGGQPAIKTVPIALDAALLKLVAGGASAGSSNGVVEGPKGGW